MQLSMPILRFSLWPPSWLDRQACVNLSDLRMWLRMEQCLSWKTRGPMSRLGKDKFHTSLDNLAPQKVNMLHTVALTLTVSRICNKFLITFRYKCTFSRQVLMSWCFEIDHVPVISKQFPNACIPSTRRPRRAVLIFSLQDIHQGNKG